MFPIDNYPTALGFVADVIGVIGACFAFLAWVWAKSSVLSAKREQERLNQRIPVILKSVESERSMELPVNLRRGDISRQELLGRLGMLPMRDKGARYSLQYLHTSEFYDQLNAIAESSVPQSCIIHCSDHEIEQFDLHEEKGGTAS